jgi:hypothetical protein
VRFLHAGIGLNIALLGLNAIDLTAIATASPIPTINRVSTIERMAIDSSKSDRITIQGNGVEFTLPAGFQGGSPSDAQTKAAMAKAAKMFPSMASFAKVFENDPAIIRAIATNTSAQSPSIVLVTKLPIPANVSLAEIQSAMTTAFSSMLPPEFKLVEHEIVKIGDREIVKMGIDVDIRGNKLKESIGFLREGNEVFQVIYIYDRANSDSAGSVFDLTIESFKSTTKSSAKTPII